MIFAGTNGYLDDLKVEDRSSSFRRGAVSLPGLRHRRQLLKDIIEKKTLDDDSEEPHQGGAEGVQGELHRRAPGCEAEGDSSVKELSEDEKEEDASLTRTRSTVAAKA